MHYQHSFDTRIAKKYGVYEAILIANIDFWLSKNKANEKHFYDGRYWTYNSVRAFTEMFDYWSEQQIYRLLKKLEDGGVLISGNYNKSKYDRTKWYSFTDSFIKENETILRYREMYSSESRNQNTETEEPIPDRKPDRKLDNNSYAIAEATQQNILCFREELEKRLFHDIEKTCLSCLADRSQYDYPRERKFIKVLVGKTKEKENPSDFMKSFFMTFGRLKRDGGKFWSSQPWLPSTLASGGIYPRIVEEMNREPEYIETGAKVTFV